MGTIGGFLLGLLDASIWAALYGAVFLYFRFLYGDLYKQTRREEERPDGTVTVIDPRAEMVLNLRIGSRSARYNAFLGGFLDWLDRQFATREISSRKLEDTQERAQAEARNRKPWSYGALSFVLRIAIVYSVLTLFLQWAVTGDTGFLASLQVFPAEQSWWFRWGLLLLVVVSIVLSKIEAKNLKIKFHLFSGEVSKLQPWITGVYLIVIIISFAGTPEFFFTLLFVFAIAVPSGILAAYLIAFAGAGAVASGSAVLGAVPSILLIDRIRAKVDRRLPRPSLALLVQILLFMAGFLAAAAFLEAETQEGRALFSFLLLFVGLLPILNALADFASIGLTRYLLRKGIESRVYLWAPVDLILGLAVFALLGTAILGCVVLVAALGGPPLIDLEVLFGDATTEGSIRHDPRAYWWLYATFLSTLLPTAAHLGVGIFSLGLLSIPPLSRAIADGLEEGDTPRGRAATLMLVAALAASPSLALFLCWHLISLGLSFDLGEGLLLGFEGIAVALGALNP